jgi:hypothetical protein
MFGFELLVFPVVARQRSADVQVAEQFAAMPGVFTGNDRYLGENPFGPFCYILKVADGGGDNV